MRIAAAWRSTPQRALSSRRTFGEHDRSLLAQGWRLDKPDDRTSNDAIVALYMAVDAAENRPEPVRLLGFL